MQLAEKLDWKGLIQYLTHCYSLQTYQYIFSLITTHLITYRCTTLTILTKYNSSKHE